MVYARALPHPLPGSLACHHSFHRSTLPAGDAVTPTSLARPSRFLSRLRRSLRPHRQTFADAKSIGHGDMTETASHTLATHGKAITTTTTFADGDGAATTSNRKKAAGAIRCSVCDKVFKRSEHCARHELSHTNERPFSCQFCRRSYSRKYVSPHIRSAPLALHS